MPAPDARYQSEFLARFINKVMERGKKGLAERIVYGALGSHRGPHRQRPARSLRAGARQRDACDRGQAAARRRRDLSGSGADRRTAPSVAGDALASDCRREPAPASRCRRSWQTSCSTRSTTPAPRSSAARTRTAWPRPTAPSRIIASSRADSTSVVNSRPAGLAGDGVRGN